VLRLSANRPTDTLGRFAGGKFAMLLPETNAHGARTVAGRAVERVYELQMLHAALGGRDRVTVTVSGISRDTSRAFDRHAAATVLPDELIATAERALQTARAAGGERIILIDIADLGARP
jgi:PleD family two-component response regulator